MIKKTPTIKKHRFKLMHFQRAFPRYESAYSITKETGDRKLQLEVLAGMAKCAAAAGDLEQVGPTYR